MSWNKDSIHALLDRNDKAVYRALQAIYARQTSDERAAQYTRHTNGVGFSKIDAEILSDIARKSRRFGGLTQRQTELVRRRIKRYWRQLIEIADENDKRLGRVVAPQAGPVHAEPTPDEVYQAIDRAELVASGVPVVPAGGLVAPGDYI